MKKYLAMLLAVLMLASLSSAAFAESQTETTEIAEYHWEDIESIVEESGVSGQFYTLNDYSVSFWVPDFLEFRDRTDEQIEEGYTAIASSADDHYQLVIRDYSYDQPVDSIEEWQEMLAEQLGIEESVICLVNGFKVLEYLDAENDVLFVDLHITDGSILEFAFTPFSDKDYSVCTGFMTMSIMPAED